MTTLTQEEIFLSRLCSNLNGMLLGQHKIAVAVFLLNESARDLRAQTQAHAPEMLPELDALKLQHVEEGTTGDCVPAAIAMLQAALSNALDSIGDRLAAAHPDNPVAQNTGD